MNQIYSKSSHVIDATVKGNTNGNFHRGDILDLTKKVTTSNGGVELHSTSHQERIMIKSIKKQDLDIYILSQSLNIG